jgi:hypothetical protein
VCRPLPRSQTGLHWNGLEWTGSDKLGQDRTEQDRTGQDGTAQDRTGHDTTDQNSQQKRWGLLECIGGHWNTLGAFGMHWWPVEWIGCNWSGYVPSTCTQALISVTTFYRNSRQQSASLIQMTKRASKPIRFELPGAQTVCLDCSHAVPT